MKHLTSDRIRREPVVVAMTDGVDLRPAPGLAHERVVVWHRPVVFQAKGVPGRDVRPEALFTVRPRGGLPMVVEAR